MELRLESSCSNVVRSLGFPGNLVANLVDRNTLNTSLLYFTERKTCSKNKVLTDSNTGIEQVRFSHGCSKALEIALVRLNLSRTRTRTRTSFGIIRNKKNVRARLGRVKVSFIFDPEIPKALGPDAELKFRFASVSSHTGADSRGPN